MLEDGVCGSSKSLTRVTTLLREICCAAVRRLERRREMRIGGRRAFVAIDESKFRHKRKYGLGRFGKTWRRRSWVFGMMEVRRSRRRPVLKLVETRSRRTLLPIIRKYVRPGSEIISDCWRSYNRLSHDGYIHYQVNHQRYFVHPGTGAHTQHIERAWRTYKEDIYRWRELFIGVLLFFKHLMTASMLYDFQRVTFIIELSCIADKLLEITVRSLLLEFCGEKTGYRAKFINASERKCRQRPLYVCVCVTVNVYLAVLVSLFPGAELSSSKRRKNVIECKYPCVMPVEYQLEHPGHTSMYVPILSMIQELFKKTDIPNKITEPNIAFGQYASCSDGSHFLENDLLSTGDLVLPLQLYIDDLEIANPLGTSRKIHKLCAVCWFLANVPPKYRSALHAILVKVTDLHKTEFSTMAAASPEQPMVLRVVETDRARKLKLSSRTGSVDALINIIKEQLEIDLNFSLLYEDPDFDGKLTSLADIEELPQKAVVHISLSQDSSLIY
ncbi:hypothetical protein JOB18_023807 [Solea senegalensis]|uniref:ISXO2-like transposase domain-containing protein n=1 Tax=Solea senegalensis TaxID=28829 RepID=A0AAV6SMJ9_SOLSE|nr:hypothetical protein JOB18_023807 [Solea senegalensis]